jgi:hypothetical protein
MINFVAKVFINVYQTLWQIFTKEIAKIIIRIATNDVLQNCKLTCMPRRPLSSRRNNVILNPNQSRLKHTVNDVT